MCFGNVATMPTHSSLLRSHPSAENLLIVRRCYERVLSIIRKRVDVPGLSGGLIFSGAQGNGKVTYLFVEFMC